VDLQPLLEGVQRFYKSNKSNYTLSRIRAECPFISEHFGTFHNAGNREGFVMLNIRNMNAAFSPALGYHFRGRIALPAAGCGFGGDFAESSMFRLIKHKSFRPADPAMS